MLLRTHRVEKIWGTTNLPQFFEPPENPVGEIWFEAPADAAALPLLVKYIFTSDKLSVQVHPDNAAARARGMPHGKSEGWFIISAEPGAAVGIGTRSALSPAELARAAEDGSIETLLEWHPVGVGDYFFVPAGTVHAIGAGVGLIEVQQNIDVTYRLYDYGRPRALHLADAVDVADARPYEAKWTAHIVPGSTLKLPSGRDFELYHVTGDPLIRPATGTNAWLCVPLNGAVRIDGQPVRPGECAMTADLRQIETEDETSMLLARGKHANVE